MSERQSVTLGAGPGSHTAYFDEAGDLVIDWYDFGPHAPYESANLLHFGVEAQRQLQGLLGVSAGSGTQSFLDTIKAHFKSYFAVERFAKEQGIQFRTSVNFSP